MIESLFGYNAVDKNRKAHKESSSQDPSPQHIQIIDPKKAQNLAILLRALNVTTEEVQDALHEGNLCLAGVKTNPRQLHLVFLSNHAYEGEDNHTCKA